MAAVWLSAIRYALACAGVRSVATCTGTCFRPSFCAAFQPRVPDDDDALAVHHDGLAEAELLSAMPPRRPPPHHSNAGCCRKADGVDGSKLNLHGLTPKQDSHQWHLSAGWCYQPTGSPLYRCFAASQELLI